MEMIAGGEQLAMWVASCLMMIIFPAFEPYQSPLFAALAAASNLVRLEFQIIEFHAVSLSLARALFLAPERGGGQ